MHITELLPKSFVLVTALCLTGITVARADDKTAASTDTENALLAVLRSDAPPGDKAITCKRLAIHGSSAAVPDLARLLPDPQLSSWARIALEAIPGPVADQALRDALDSLEGKRLVGTINSIGVRRDVGAVELLTARLRHPDDAVASAAAVALGHIGNDASTAALREALATASPQVRSAVAEGCVLCAEKLVAAGKSDAAIQIYDQVRAAEVPKQRIIEATRGAILARKQDGIPLLLEQFRSTDKRFFQLALQTAREFPGGAIDKALAAELDRTPPARAALLVHAMADRGETVDLASILKAAQQGDSSVRLAAIDALSRIGDVSCLAVLLQIAVDSEIELAQAARATLAELPGAEVDALIAAKLPESNGKSYPLLIELVGQRRIAAVPALLKALGHSDKAVRSAALTALGETVALDNLNTLVSQVVAPKRAEDAPIARQALRAACVRMPDREACAAQLASALNRAPAMTKTALLEILSEVGGAKALQTLGVAAKSDDAELQDAGSRLLGKWNSVAAAPVLLDLAKSGEGKYQVRALRGYIGLARKFAMPERQRAEMCRTAMAQATRPDEMKLALEVLKLHPSPAGLKLASEAIKVPALKDEATQATLVIAQKLGGKGVDVGKLLAGVGLGSVKLEIVKAHYGSGSTQKDVTALIRKHAGSSPLVTLASSSYNTSLGGDPAPGVVKQLTIEYKINGKNATAKFAENALILLPVPK